MAFFSRQMERADPMNGYHVSLAPSPEQQSTNVKLVFLGCYVERRKPILKDKSIWKIYFRKFILEIYKFSI